LIWTDLMEKNCDIFVVKNLFLLIFGTWVWDFFNFLNYGWTWTEFLNSGLDLDRKI